MFILVGLQEAMSASVVNAGVADTLLAENSIFRKNCVDSKRVTERCARFCGSADSKEVTRSKGDLRSLENGAFSRSWSAERRMGLAAYIGEDTDA